jgi:HD-GYP domain-containing protein (c-di-GMP phosphodiesterase class II)
MNPPSNYPLDERDINAIRKEALEISNIGLYRYKMDGTVLFMDWGSMHIFDLDQVYPDPSQIIGKNISDLFIYIQPKYSLREAVVKNGRVRNLEYPFRTLTGLNKWILHDSYLAKDSATGEDVIQAIVQDITAQKRAERIQNSVFAISEATVHAENLDELYEAIHGIVRQLMNANNFYIALYDQVNQLLTFPYFVDQFDKTPAAKKPGKGLTEYVLRSRCSLLATPDVFDHLLRSGEIESVGADSIDWLGVPLVIREETIGVLVVQSYSEGVRYTESDKEILEFVSTQIAMAIQRKRSQEHVQRQIQRLSALRTIDLAISGSVDLKVTLDILVDQVVSKLHVDATDVFVFNDNTRTLEYASGSGFRSASRQNTRLRVGEEYAGQAVLRRKVISIADLSATEYEFFRSSFFLKEGFVAYYAVPLVAKGQIKGVLEIFNRTRLNPDQEWLDFLEALGMQAAIAIADAQLFESLQRTNTELIVAYDATIESWAQTIELRDRELPGHIHRLTDVAESLAQRMGFKNDRLLNFRRGVLLHDIGKLVITDSILMKPGPLEPEEVAEVRMHPIYAFQLLSSIPFLNSAMPIPYCHHERWDGSGYPRGLRGEEIPLEARIFSVVDVWDSLTSNKPYRKAWKNEDAAHYLREQSGKGFDPMIVEEFLRMSQEGF